MANLHNEFLQFYENLQIPKKKKDEIEKSAKKIKECIKKAIEMEGHKVTFREQGSSEMGTRIRTKDGKCDLDIGCYIDLGDKFVTSHNLQKWVYNALISQKFNASHNKKCIRVSNPEYDIDIPVYIEQKDDVPLLAVDNDAYMKSDPQGLIRWFEEKTKDNKALIRIISYLKAWGSYNDAVTMPPGLAFSILTIENQYIVTDRDDLSLLHTLENILNALEANFRCIVPVEPRDDIFKEYPEKRKDDIMTALRIYVKNAQEACNASTEYQSNELWKKFLGDNYPRFNSSMWRTNNNHSRKKRK
jgi:hypothetical protein